MSLQRRFIADYEDEDYEEGEETEAEEEREGQPPRREENSVIDESETTGHHKEEEEQEVSEKTDTELDPHAGEKESPTSTTTSSPVHVPPPHPVDLCLVGNGGCDHNCRFTTDDSSSGGRVECSCFSGFELSPADGRTCHGESPDINLFVFFSELIPRPVEVPLDSCGV